MFFFLLWPLFARAPRHWFLENFLLSAPGVQSVFFLLRSVGRRDLSAGPEQKKKNTTQGVFFLLRPRGKAREGEAPLGAGTGPEQKKKHHPGCFFLLRPRRKAREGEAPAAKKKNTLGGVFFFALAPCRRTGLLLPLPFAGAEQKKKHPGWCFFLLRPRADAHSLTAGLGGDASPSPGWCFFFCCGPARCGPARTLTHSRWAGAISARPGWCLFFLLRPRRVFLDNNKKCLGYYIGSKKTRRGHSKKKNTTSVGPVMLGTIRGLLFRSIPTPRLLYDSKGFYCSSSGRAKSWKEHTTCKNEVKR